MGFFRSLLCVALVAACSASVFAADLTVWGIQTFSKDTDELINTTLQNFAKEKGITAEYVVVPANYLNERLAAALEGGNPPDVFMNVGDSLQYYFNLGVTEDVSDVMAEINQRTIFDPIQPLLKYNGVYHATPVEVDVVPMFVRTDHLAKVGVTTVPDNWEDLRKAAVEIKKAGIVNYPMGVGLSACNDSEASIRMVVWSFGGALFSPDGKKATLDTPETHAAMEFLVKAFRDDKVISRSTLTWDDSGNNTAWQTGNASIVINSPSIYSWMADSNKEMFDNSTMMVGPKGTGAKARPASHVSSQSFMVAKNGKNIPLAKDFLRYFYRDENYRALINSCGGRWVPIFPSMFDDMPLFKDNARLANFKSMAMNGALIGYQASPSAATAEVYVSRIMPSLVGKVLDDETPIPEAVAWANAEIQKIIDKHGK
jgi:multiple sugar transport system substrate-binding protein